ncbi:MAG TPA: AAA family ATPase, partial [Gemmatimonadaceae bacterium]|nr:AAA family ATPase [Gemmatimonadaceae bacterium]
MKLLTLRTLGECVIEVGDRKLAPSAPHLFAVLLYLGVERGREIPRSTLFELLFPGEPGSAAAHNLRQLLYRLRGMGAALDCSSASVRLDSTSVVDALERRLARPYHETSKEPATSCALLPDYEPPTAPFSQWLEGYRDSAQRALMRKLGDDLQAARRGANWGAVEALSSSLLTVDPFNETATLCLAESLARSGSKHRALSLLNQFEQDVGRSVNSLALPSRLLKRRISESSVLGSPESSEAPLVGRTQEMEMLADVWAQARAGRCIAVSVTGEKSIGKSRLAEEFLSLVRLDGTGSVIFSRRRAADQARPLSLFADVCKQMICMPGAAGCAPSRLSFLTRLTTAPEGFESLRAEQSEVEFTIGNLRRSLLELVECVTEERALIFAIDDARFLDSLSREILTQLCQQLSSCPLLILLTGDVELSPSNDCVRLRLQPLARAALAHVAEHALARRQWPIDDQLRDWCVEMASGNPGYLELLLQSARSGCERQLPRDLLALVDERIAALSPSARHALHSIAIFGAACDGEVVEQLCGLGRTELLDALQELESGSMVATTRDGTVCRTALIEECTRASASQSVASVLHARAARYLEQQSRRHPPSQAIAWRIAAHWAGAGNHEGARHWQRVCWRQSIAIGQPMLAANEIRMALSDASTLGDQGALLDDLTSALFAAQEGSALQEVLQLRIQLCAQ